MDRLGAEKNRWHGKVSRKCIIHIMKRRWTVEERNKEKKITLERVKHRVIMEKRSREGGKEAWRVKEVRVTYFKIPGAS